MNVRMDESMNRLDYMGKDLEYTQRQLSQVHVNTGAKVEYTSLIVQIDMGNSLEYTQPH